jgi:predicted Fe-Mo cluster-binding NifX family protein
MRIAVPVTPDGLVDHSWGRAPRITVFDVVDGLVASQQIFEVDWDRLHDAAGEGNHHARVARFLRDNAIDRVAAEHMGPPMVQMLAKMGIALALGASGDARLAAVETANATS